MQLKLPVLLQFTLVSIDGRKVVERVYNFNKGLNNIDVEGKVLPVGTYIAEIIIDGKKYNKKLIIAK